jgi:protein gp37
MGDLFHDTVQHEWLDSVMRMVADNERHTFILLTKRPGNMKRYFDGYHIPSSRPHPNLVLGTSVEDQQTADERIPILRGIPAAKIFVSIEPMVGPIDLRLDCEKCGHLTDAECPGSGRNCRMIRPLDCVILGGESGGNARRLDPQWVVSIRDQCGYAGVPFMFKQWSHENKNEVDAASGLPLLQGGLTHSALAWNIKNNIKEA